jgi:acetate kinase
MAMAGKMTFLVINCGTSSIKMTLFSEDKKRLIEGSLKNLFSPSSILEINQKKVEVSAQSYQAALKILIEHFEQEGLVASSLMGIGHRVVHGGEKYTKSTLITHEVERDLQALIELAPLHNPPAISGIECAREFFPQIPQVAVFDTAFHVNLPQKALFYPIPWKLSQKYKIRRYGFHGIAHAFSWKKYVQNHKNSAEKHRVITVHLGSGCSMAAIRHGQSVDTTMGFTPLDGLMMATRSGELDPSIIAFLCNKERKSADEVMNILNHQSGLLGVSGKTANMEEIVASTDPQSKLSLEMYVYHIQKKIGAFIAALEGIDAIIFSGGVGENSWEIRKKIVEAFSWYSIFIDEAKNRSCTHLNLGEIHNINRPDSKVSIYVVGCDENLFIVDEMKEVLI